MKNILITGSTDGIGKLAAIQLAKQGHRIYLHGRNSEKLKAVIREVKEASSNENIGGFTADFSKLTEVKKMAQEIQKELSVLDVLINNAGVFKVKNEITTDGYDIRFVVNYFAPFILTNALSPLLNKSNDPRIVNLSSAAQTPVSHEALMGKAKLSAQEAYAQSKLAITMWSMYLAQKEQNLTVTPVNPGSLLNTKMVKEAYGQHWSSADKGANILVDLAVSEKYKGVTGKYFDNDQGHFGNAHPDAYDETKISRLIETTNNILE